MPKGNWQRTGKKDSRQRKSVAQPESTSSQAKPAQELTAGHSLGNQAILRWLGQDIPMDDTNQTRPGIEAAHARQTSLPLAMPPRFGAGGVAPGLDPIGNGPTLPHTSAKKAQRSPNGNGGEATTSVASEQEAHSTFNRGNRLYEASRYRQAIILWEQVRQSTAIDSEKKRDILFNIGLANMKLERYATATIYFEQYRDQPGADIEKADEKLEVAQMRSGAVVPGEGEGAEPEARIETEDEARKWFRRGERWFDAGGFRKAIILWERVRQSPAIGPEIERDLLFNIGQANIELSRFATATIYFEQYLAMPGADAERGEMWLREAQQAAGSVEETGAGDDYKAAPTSGAAPPASTRATPTSRGGSASQAGGSGGRVQAPAADGSETASEDFPGGLMAYRPIQDPPPPIVAFSEQVTRDQAISFLWQGRLRPMWEHFRPAGEQYYAQGSQVADELSDEFRIDTSVPRLFEEMRDDVKAQFAAEAEMDEPSGQETQVEPTVLPKWMMTMLRIKVGTIAAIAEPLGYEVSHVGIGYRPISGKISIGAGISGSIDRVYIVDMETGVLTEDSVASADLNLGVGGGVGTLTGLGGVKLKRKGTPEGPEFGFGKSVGFSGTFLAEFGVSVSTELIDGGDGWIMFSMGEAGGIHTGVSYGSIASSQPKQNYWELIGQGKGVEVNLIGKHFIQGDPWIVFSFMRIDRTSVIKLEPNEREHFLAHSLEDFAKREIAVTVNIENGFSENISFIQSAEGNRQVLASEVDLARMIPDGDVSGVNKATIAKEVTWDFLGATSPPWQGQF